MSSQWAPSKRNANSVTKIALTASSISDNTSASSYHTKHGYAPLQQVICNVALRTDEDTMLLAMDDLLYCKLHNLVQPRFVYSTKDSDQILDVCVKCPKQYVKETDINYLFSRPPRQLNEAAVAWKAVMSKDASTEDGRAATWIGLQERERWIIYLIAAYEEGCMRRVEICRALRHRDAASILPTFDDFAEYIEPTPNRSSYGHDSSTSSSSSSSSRMNVEDPRVSSSSYSPSSEQESSSSHTTIEAKPKVLTEYSLPLLAFFESFKWRSAQHTSTALASTKKGNGELVCKQYCSEHDALGDLIPYRPGNMYQECGICVKPKPRRNVQQQVFKEREDRLY